MYIYIYTCVCVSAMLKTWVFGTGHLGITGLPAEVERSSSERFAESEQEFWTQTVTQHVETAILKLTNPTPVDFPTLPSAQSQRGVKPHRNANVASFCQFLASF